jgi:7-cyano-7-deazaguanine synthase
MSVILLSGGLDSAVCLALRRSPVALAVHYGQPHAGHELVAARKLARAYAADLVHVNAAIPSAASPDDPAMLWPGRNIVLLSLAAALAQTRGLDVVVIGANRDDHDGYPDCRPEFFAAAEPVLGVKIDAPLLHLTKPEVGQLAAELGLPIRDTWSCYYPTPDGRACGSCDACKGRERAYDGLAAARP